MSPPNYRSPYAYRNGKIIILEIESSDKVVDVKKKLQLIEGIAIKQLALNNKLLEDDVSLVEYNIEEDTVMQLSLEQDQRSCDSSFTINEKGSFKWFGEVAELCDFIERLELLAAKWATPGGGSKQFENEDVSIRWYSNNRTIIVKGTKANEVKAKILSIIEAEKAKKSFLHGERSKYDTLHMEPRLNNLHTDLINTDNTNLRSHST